VAIRNLERDGVAGVWAEGSAAEDIEAGKETSKENIDFLLWKNVSNGKTDCA
jgi:hypothetical protein